MKLKKYIFAAGLALVSLCASAAVEDIRIYINPGHGSWGGASNRHLPTIGHSPIDDANPDTTDFFESNTNLWKCLQMFHRLKDYGFKHDGVNNGMDLTQNIVMSRIESGPYPFEEVTLPDGTVIDPDSDNAYSRPLTEIAQEVDANNFDMFVSVHSNAYVDASTVNYLYFIYNIYAYPLDGGAADSNLKPEETNNISIAMSQKGWNHRIQDRHTQWTNYDNPVGAGSVKIEAGNYIVTRHSVPGYLVEGYFHTYQPARHRAMNADVCAVEGLAYARGIADYFGAPLEATGEIYGIVRDLNEKFSDPLYTPRAGTDDVYKPLNGVDVTLKQGETVVATYKTDVNYNGAFVFKDLQPGDYTVEFAHADYKPADPITVTVKAATTSYPTAFLENVNYVPPTKVYVNYPDSTAGKDGYNLFPTYNMGADASTEAFAELEGKTVRRTLLRDDKVYFLALDAENAPYLYVYDVATQALAATLSTAGTKGDVLNLSDIQFTADGVLVACSKARTHFSVADAQTDGKTERGTAYFYKWANDENGVPTGEPIEWFSTQGSANQYIAVFGESFFYKGTSEEGSILVACDNGYPGGSQRVWFQEIMISSGQKMGEANQRPDDGAYSVIGDTHTIYLSPIDESKFIVLSNTTSGAADFTIACDAAGTGSVRSRLPEGLLAANVAHKAGFFKFAGRSLMVAPDITADGKVQGLKLIDITEGLDKAVEVKTTCQIEATEFTYAAAHGELALTLSTDEKTIGAEMELFLVVDGKVTKWTEKITTVTPASGGTANPFAYALKSEVVDGKLNISYSLNADATDVNIIVKNEVGEEVAASAEGAKTKGAYTAEISVADLADGKYTWEISVAGEVKETAVSFHGDNYWHPRGLDIDNNMESDAFGTVYVAEGQAVPATGYYSSGSGTGVYIYNADMTAVTNPEGGLGFNGGFTTLDISYACNPVRVRVADDGRIFVTRSNGAGDFITYAESHADFVATNKLTTLLVGGTFDATTYEYSIDGAFVAAPTIGFDVKGSGEDLKVIAHTVNNKVFGFNAGGSQTSEYNLGTATALPAATRIENLSGYTIAPQSASVEYDNQGGIWYCQHRANPSNSQPALIYVDANGDQRLFEGDGGKPRGGGAIRVSPDGKQIAIASSVTSFTIYNVMYSDGAPALQEVMVINHGIGTNCNDIAWDLAGNIYICGNSGEWFKGFALPRSEAFTTKAASKYGFEISGSSIIENIEAEDANAPAVYYNLQGIKVENPANGVYIVKRGNKVSKELVK